MVCASALRYRTSEATSAIITPSANTPAPLNMRRTSTGPNAANSSRMCSESTASQRAQDASADASAAGVSATDSPQPQAEVWFGLLNTKPDDNLSTLKSISVPSRNSTALGSIISLTPLSSTTSSRGAAASAYSMV